MAQLANGAGGERDGQDEPRSSPSLATLSAHLGLSAAAISRVLNRAPAAKSIPQVTQDRIFAAARELNYRPNALARSLRRGCSMTIGVMVPEISEGYATLVLAGLEQALLEAGYAFFLTSHRHRPETIAQSHAMFGERAVDGIIAIDTALPPVGSLPTVSVSCPVPHPGLTAIVLNHRRAADLALHHLVSLGHTRVAIIRGQGFSSDAEPRWEAIRHAAGALHLPLSPSLVAELEGDGSSPEPGYLATRRLLAAGSPFSALFAFNDISAIGAIRALREAGLRVPGDVSVVGFDDVQSAAFQNPALTTVRQPLRAMGVLAARALIDRIRCGGDAPPETRTVTVEPELVVRDSTGPASHPSVAPTPAPGPAAYLHAR